MAYTTVAVEGHDVPVRTRRSGTVLDEIAHANGQILDRAFRIFQETGCRVGRDLDNWLAAERELIWRPPIELSEKDDAYTIQAAVAGVDPDELDVQVTDEDVLIRADVHHGHTASEGTVHLCEFLPGKLFRSIHLPTRVDPWKAEAVCRNGLLEVTLPKTRKGDGRRTIDVMEI